MNMYEAVLELYIGDQLVQREIMQAPQIILKQQFMSLAKKIANDKRPMRLRLIMQDVIWDQYEQKQKVLDNYVEFNNKGDFNDD